MSRYASSYILALTGMVAILAALVIDTRAEQSLREARDILHRAERLTRELEMTLDAPCDAETTSPPGGSPEPQPRE